MNINIESYMSIKPICNEKNLKLFLKNKTILEMVKIKYSMINYNVSLRNIFYIEYCFDIDTYNGYYFDNENFEVIENKIVRIKK